MRKRKDSQRNNIPQRERPEKISEKNNEAYGAISFVSSAIVDTKRESFIRSEIASRRDNGK